MSPATGGAVVVYEQRLPTCQFLGQFGRVRDRGRTADELRLRAVEGADAGQAPQHVGDVAAEDAAVRVQFVDDDVLEVLEETVPLVVVGEHAGMEHVRVGDHDVPGQPDGAPRGDRRVAVVGIGLDVDAERADEVV